MLITFAMCRFYQNRSDIIAVQSNLIPHKSDVFASEYIQELNTQQLFSKCKVTLMMHNEIRERKDEVTVASVLLESDFDVLGKNNWRQFDLETLRWKKLFEG